MFSPSKMGARRKPKPHDHAAACTRFTAYQCTAATEKSTSSSNRLRTCHATHPEDRTVEEHFSRPVNSGMKSRADFPTDWRFSRWHEIIPEVGAVMRDNSFSNVDFGPAPFLVRMIPEHFPSLTINDRSRNRPNVLCPCRCVRCFVTDHRHTDRPRFRSLAQVRPQISRRDVPVAYPRPRRIGFDNLVEIESQSLHGYNRVP